MDEKKKQDNNRQWKRSKSMILDELNNNHPILFFFEHIQFLKFKLTDSHRRLAFCFSTQILMLPFLQVDESKSPCTRNQKSYIE